MAKQAKPTRKRSRRTDQYHVRQEKRADWLIKRVRYQPVQDAVDTDTMAVLGIYNGESRYE